MVAAKPAACPPDLQLRPMTALLEPLQRLTSRLVHEIFQNEDTPNSTEFETGCDFVRIARCLVEANRLVRRAKPKQQELIMGSQTDRLAQFEAIPDAFIQQVANALDWRSRESLALVSRTIREAFVLPSHVRSSKKSNKNFDRVMARHKASRFEDLRSLQLMFWSYTLAASGPSPQQWLGHRMPNLRSLSVSVGPALSVGTPLSWSDVVSAYPDYGFFDVPGLREAQIKPMPLLTTLKIELKIRRGPYGYLRYENAWDYPDTWQVSAVIFAEGSALRRCSLEEVQWPQHLFPFFQSLVAFHYKGTTIVLTESAIGKLVESSPALRSIWLEGDGFMVEGVGRSTDRPKRRTYARLQHVAIGLASSSDRLAMLHHFMDGGARDVVITLGGLRYEGAQPVPYTIHTLAIGLAAISYNSASFAATQGGQQSPAQAPQRLRTRISIALNRWQLHRFEDIMSPTMGRGYSELANLVSLFIHERFVTRLFEPTDATGSWFLLQPEEDSSEDDSDGSEESPAPRGASFLQLQELTIWFSSCWETRRVASAGIFDPDYLLVDRPMSGVGVERFPRVHTLTLSAGTEARHAKHDINTTGYKALSRRCPDDSISGTTLWCTCDVEGGFPVALRDIAAFVQDCDFPSLSRLKLCGLQYVDLDIVDQLAGLQAIADVEFQAERIPTDVQDVTQESQVSHADELFELLEQS